MYPSFVRNGKKEKENIIGQKQAELCEIELSDDEGEVDSNAKRQNEQKLESLKAQLKVLLRARL